MTISSTADGKAREAARIRPDGSFFVATHLPPGKYTVSASAWLPESDESQRRRGVVGPDLEATQELVIPDPPKTQAGAEPVKLTLAMAAKTDRIVAADAPNPLKAEAGPMQELSSVKFKLTLRDEVTGKPVTEAVCQYGWADPEKSKTEFQGIVRTETVKNADGVFELLMQPDKNFYAARFRIIVPGYDTALITSFDAQPGPVRDIAVKLTPGRKLSGKLRDHAGKPVAGGKVFFVPAELRNVRIIEGKPENPLPSPKQRPTRKVASPLLSARRARSRLPPNLSTSGRSSCRGPVTRLTWHSPRRRRLCSTWTIGIISMTRHKKSKCGCPNRKTSSNATF